MASFEDRVKREWQTIQSNTPNPYDLNSQKPGSKFVPDATETMTREEVQANGTKLAQIISFYGKQPVPDHLIDLYNKEIAGKGQSISVVVSTMRQWLAKKMAGYEARMAAIVNSSPAPVESSGAVETVNTGAFDEKPATDPGPSDESPVETADIQPSPDDTTKKSQTLKYVLIGVGALWAIGLIIYAVKGGKSKN